MIAFWINYAAKFHFPGKKVMYIFPLAIQALPAVLLCAFMLLCQESPRGWREEFQEIVDQLEHERRLIGDATFWNLQREMRTIAGDRKRVLVSITLIVCQQMTGTNAINTYAPTIFKNLGMKGTTTSLFGTGIYGIVKVMSCICFSMFFFVWFFVPETKGISLEEMDQL
ncbi:general substrate transporter [Immersiella caudata]|uniref:General substrate transporter n=1 Tax=Immersiella caudata TaxID=314043 RepID=A0AA40CBJ7_9PEZI|nr:general substrate transporter [Immersiella caudata]